MQNETNELNKRWTCDVQETDDGSGDLILELPQELCDQMNWKEGTILKFEGKDGCIYVTEKKNESI